MGIKKTVTTSSGITTVTVTGVAFVNGDRITGITSFTDPNDVANKSYADSKLNLDLAGQTGKFFTTTDGVNYTWDYVSNYQEFTTPGTQTFILPPQANLLFIEAVAGGSGGSAGATLNSSVAGNTWIVRTVGFAGPPTDITYANNLYVAGGGSGAIATSTDTINWTLRTSGFSSTISSLISVNNQFYLTHDSGNSVLGASSTNGIIWTLRTTRNTGYPPRWTLGFGGGNFIIGDNGGNIQSSTNFIEWTARTSGTSIQLYSSTYDGSRHYISSSGNSIRYSTDTIVWIPTTTGLGASSTVSAVFYGNNLYLAATWSTNPGRISTSTNGIQWTLRTSGLDATDLYSFAYGAGYYFVVGGVGLISRSTDGIVWIRRTSNVTQTLDDIKYLNNIFFAGNTLSYAQQSGPGGRAGSYTSWYIPRNIVYSNLTINPGAGGTGATTEAASGAVGSATTISWIGPNNQPYILTASPTAANTAASSSSFYTTAGTSSVPQFLPTSSGFSATNQTNRFQPTGGGSGAVDSGTGGSGGAVYQYGATIQTPGGYGVDTATLNAQNATAVTGLTYGLGAGGGGAGAGGVWTLRTSGTTNTIYGSIYVNQLYFVSGSTLTLFASTNSIVWTARTTTPTFAGGVNYINYLNNLYILVSSLGNIRTSTDSIIWTLRTSGITNQLNTITYANNTYVTAGVGGTIRTSTDTIVWEARTSGATNEFRSLTYANNTYVTAGTGISTSTDTIVWTARTVGITNQLNTITYANNTYVTAGDSGTIRTSTDTIVWTARTSDTTSILYALTYVNNVYVISGDSGTIRISTDTIVWTARTSGTTDQLRALTYGNNLFVAGGASGTITTSATFVGNGGNGVRGGGGGGGAVSGTLFGNGGNGGNGYVKITWW